MQYFQVKKAAFSANGIERPNGNSGPLNIKVTASTYGIRHRLPIVLAEFHLLTVIIQGTVINMIITVWSWKLC